MMTLSSCINPYIRRIETASSIKVVIANVADMIYLPFRLK
jgi:hypothetical protein